MRHLRFFLLSLAGFLVSPLSSRAQVSCPASSFSSCFTTRPITTAHDTSFCCDFLSACGYAITNHEAGQFHADVHGGFDSGGGHATLTAVDRFTVLGPSRPDPIAISALLDIHGVASSGFTGSGCSSGSASFSIASTGVPADSRSIESHCSPVSIDLTLGISISAHVGESFDLSIVTSASGSSGSGGGSADSQLRFAGLPAGYIVASCKGFRADGPVPTRFASWSALKKIYR